MGGVKCRKMLRIKIKLQRPSFPPGRKSIDYILPPPPLSQPWYSSIILTGLKGRGEEGRFI
jgi:hypothetical protein